MKSLYLKAGSCISPVQVQWLRWLWLKASITNENVYNVDRCQIITEKINYYTVPFSKVKKKKFFSITGDLKVISHERSTVYYYIQRTGIMRLSWECETQEMWYTKYQNGKYNKRINPDHLTKLSNYIVIGDLWNLKRKRKCKFRVISLVKGN